MDINRKTAYLTLIDVESKKAYSNLLLNQLTRTQDTKLRFIEPFKEVLASGNLDKIR